MSTCKCQELISKLAALEAKVEEMVIANSVIINRIANNIELKLDILANSEQISSQQKASKKPKTKTAFFKDLVKDNLKKYLDVLYTQDRINELMAIEDVKSKKTQAARIGKIAEYLYKDFKNNKEYLDKFEDVYQEYKISLEEEETKEAEPMEE